MTTSPIRFLWNAPTGDVAATGAVLVCTFGLTASRAFDAMLASGWLAACDPRPSCADALKILLHVERLHGRRAA